MSSPVRLLAVALLIVGVFASPALAHGELAAASPGFGAEVGGALDGVDLYFTTSLQEAEVTIEGPAGELLAGTIERPEPSVLRFAFDPLTVEGQYLVRFETIDSDNDVIEGAFAFTYAADATPAASITTPAADFLVDDPEGEGTSPILLLVVGIGTLVIVALAVPLAEKLRRARQLD